MPQFIGAPHRNFETTDLGIKSSTPLAPDGWVNPSDTLVLAMKILQHSWPPYIFCGSTTHAPFTFGNGDPLALFLGLSRL